MQKSGSGSTKLPVCNFFKELSFLRDSAGNRKTSNATNVSLNDTDTTEVSPVTPVNPTKRNNKRKNSSDLELGIDAMIVKALSSNVEESREESKMQRNSTDEDELFCLSLVGMLKSLPTRKKRYARMKIENIFYELSEESYND